MTSMARSSGLNPRVAVLVPVLGRPHRVKATLRGFTRTSPARVLFIADPDDADELRALRRAKAEFIAPGGNYASKIAAGVEATRKPFVFTAADDLQPLAGWFEAAVAAMTGRIEVVGVNDLIERQRRHA